MSTSYGQNSPFFWLFSYFRIKLWYNLENKLNIDDND